MRVAVSGTHCCGKSSLIEEFLRIHPGFAHEPEPYVMLEERYGEAFAAEPSLDDYYRQLDFNVTRLRCYGAGAEVIYERSPVDFLAYMLAVNDLRRDQASEQVIENSIVTVRQAIQLLDLILYLPLDDDDTGKTISIEEDPELRRAVDDQLVGLFCDGNLNLFTSGLPKVLEARGSTAQRLRTLESSLGKRRQTNPLTG